MTRQSRIIVVVAALTFLSACGDDAVGHTAEKDKTFNVAGTLLLSGAGSYYKGDACSGDGGYADIQQGAQVTIYDADGKAIAIGSLGLGVTVESRGCNFPIVVSDVPIQGEGSIYAVEVTHRGQINFTQDEAKVLGLTLGTD